MDRVCLIQAAELLQGDCLLLISKSPEIPETHLIDLERMKDWVGNGFL